MRRPLNIILEGIWYIFILTIVVKCTYNVFWDESEKGYIPPTEEEIAESRKEFERKRYVRILINDYECIADCIKWLEKNIEWEEKRGDDSMYYDVERDQQATYTLEDFIIWCCAEDCASENSSYMIYEVKEAKGMINRIKQIYQHGETISEGIYNHLSGKEIEITAEEQAQIESLEEKYKEGHNNVIHLLWKN